MGSGGGGQVRHYWWKGECESGPEIQRTWRENWVMRGVGKEGIESGETGSKLGTNQT